MQGVSLIGFKISMDLKFINAAFAKQQSIDSVIMSRPLFCFRDDMAQSQQKEKKIPFCLCASLESEKTDAKIKVYKEFSSVVKHHKSKFTYL